MMFDKQAVNSDIVAVDHKSVLTGVTRPADTMLVVCTPDPGVVDDDIITVDSQIHLRFAYRGSAHTEEYIVQHDRIFLVAASFRPDFQQNRRRFRRRIEKQ